MTREEQFEVFWRAYPRRISKATARTAFAKAIGKTTLYTMIEAIAAYVANKPSYQDFKHPSTWLNGECWDDEWTTPPIAPRPSTPFQQRHQDAINAFDHALGREHEQSTGYDIQLDATDFRTH